MRKVLIALFLLMATVSCSKKDTVVTVNKTDTIPAADTVQIPDSVNLITSAYYSSSTTADTNQNYDYRDTFYYNSDLRIEKIVSKETDVDSVVSLYTYNSNGRMSKVSVSNNYGNRWTNFDVYFYYDSKNRLDSMIRYNPDEIISYKFSYDGNNHVKHSYSYLIKAFYADYQDGDINAEETYYWNSNGSTLDSVYTGLYSATSREQVFDIKTLAIPSGNAVVAAAAIDPAYMFKLAWQYESYILDQYINVYWHQFLNPDVAVIKSGTYSYDYTNNYSFSGNGYGINAVMNEDGTVRWLIKTQVARNGLNPARGINKLEYTRVAKP
ncbi:hypothetical protein [Chitinophaga sp.]|uniref:hypothetical protein n=1 Tax=Chitinophaga sp. TaxID=1869181 RepID=UPI0031CE73AA